MIARYLIPLLVFLVLMPLYGYYCGKYLKSHMKPVIFVGGALVITILYNLSVWRFR